MCKGNELGSWLLYFEANLRPVLSDEENNHKENITEPPTCLQEFSLKKILPAREWNQKFQKRAALFVLIIATDIHSWGLSLAAHPSSFFSPTLLWRFIGMYVCLFSSCRFLSSPSFSTIFKHHEMHRDPSASRYVYTYIYIFSSALTKEQRSVRIRKLFPRFFVSFFFERYSNAGWCFSVLTR